jgi:DNA-binding CsgD family transcriptional regulator
MAGHTRDRAQHPLERPDWKTEYAELRARDQRVGLDWAELERLGIVAYLAGDEPGSIQAHTRAHTRALDAGNAPQAARAAFWIAFALIGAREVTHAAGWAARARRLLEQSHEDCVECGYVLLPQALAQIASGDIAVAETTFTAAERIGERFADADLTSLARQGRGRVLVALGRVADGATLFDEVMVAVTAGELTPVIAGTVYCSVVSACFDMLDIRRAQEWTAALDEWCATQPGLVPYRGECLAHRAEILSLHGHWPEALDEARRACDALMAANSPRYAVAAYAVAELHRLRGETRAAEEAYRQAGEHGRAPHPGLALLRLAQGDVAAARAAIERMMAEPTRGRQRADVLAAAVDVSLASGDLATAERAVETLRAMVVSPEAVWMRAMAAAAEGAVHVAAGRAGEALAPLRNALTIWDDLQVTYEAARVRVLLGRACRALGDADGARMEWDAAARVFHECGAAPALADVERLRREPPASAQAPGGRLTSRELQVLRLVARGRTNRAIARELEISDKTVARHVSNIFTKLSLSTRAAATAYAFTHRLMS